MKKKKSDKTKVEIKKETDTENKKFSVLKNPDGLKGFSSFSKIEKKWQKKWEENKTFEANVDKKKKKFFFTTPYPYISGSLHLGHGRAVIESDVYCRYRRMKGENVLFPMAFHITGTP